MGVVSSACNPALPPLPHPGRALWRSGRPAQRCSSCGAPVAAANVAPPLVRRFPRGRRRTPKWSSCQTGAQQELGHSFTSSVDGAITQPVGPARLDSNLFEVVLSKEHLVPRHAVGREGGISVPNRIYARTADDAKAKFGNVAKIRSGFASTPSSYKLKYDQPSRSFTRGFRRTLARQRPDRVAGSVVSVPAIYVTIG